MTFQRFTLSEFFSYAILVKVGFSLCLLLASLPASSHQDGLSITGNLVQGGLVFGQASSGSKVKINGRSVRVSSTGEFIVGFGRDYPSKAVLMVVAGDGSVKTHVFNVEPRTYDIQRIDGLPDSLINPGPDVLDRIRKESAEIALARSADEDRMDFKSGFVWPVRGQISGVYGSQRILNGFPKQPHFGIDIAAPLGTTVVAPASGVVTYSEDMYYSGHTLVIDHGYNLSSSFLHLHRVLVNVGDRVKQGEPIAQVGATGRSTGPHLDWRMNWHQQRIDPGLLLGLKAH